MYLEDVTEVNEHVAGALGPAGDVHTGRDHVGALTAPGEEQEQEQEQEQEGQGRKDEKQEEHLEEKKLA